ncbi:hypothetical protein [Candidatus Methylacidithermus pantelleriae]|uniref:Uncharacterized protein n=1 Tax=Candidatus Methylacidithermus pantelleriae TaxID=2744239 RepID=A0A8J2FTK6_9BACT|nr:hypothetical protein [Candidatus Methylacidithermus pantelleriae]CAF0703175.1 hypothetical protein MPNT_510012 [Candidatus Methylacidithermus pantelleriae]
MPDWRREHIRPVGEEIGRVRVDHGFLWPSYGAWDERGKGERGGAVGTFFGLRDLFL